MISSGIKRGLAASAITAMAVAGVPLLASPASANSFAEQLSPTQVRLYSLTSGKASTVNDGVNTTVHLLAGGGTGVTSVKFEYTVDGATYNAIATVTRDANGVFTNEWTPPAVLNNVSLTVRATALDASGAAIGTPVTAPVTPSAQTSSVDISTAEGAQVGVFAQPYDGDAGTTGNNNAGQHNYDLGVIAGTTSDTTGANPLTSYNLTTGAQTGAAVYGTIFGTVANGVRPFTTTVDFSNGTGGAGYAFGANGNDAVVGVTDGSDDAEAVKVYQQTIANVTATSPAAIPATTPAGTASGTITVTDQNGKPVRGAQVIFDRDGDGNVGATENNEHYYTNVNGVATIPNLAAPATAGTATYTVWVNTTDSDAYDNGIDFQRTLTVTSYAQTPSTLAAASADGAAFDLDEYAAGDLSVLAKDQNGAPLAGQTVQYTQHFVPFTAPAQGAPATPDVSGTTSMTGSDGKATIPFTNYGSGTYTFSTYINRDGNPGPQTGTADIIAPDLVVKAGQAALAFNDASPVNAAQGSTKTFSGTLKLEDGTVLPGRATALTYTPATGGNAAFAAQANQPTGTTRTSDTAATATTDANGVFSVAVTDPATPNTAELGGSLAVASATNAIGNAGAAQKTITVNFTVTTAPAGSTITYDAAGAPKPGKANTGGITVKDSTGLPVRGLAVNLTIDKGFFTDGTEAATPTIGGLQGKLKSLGTSITVTTDSTGHASFQTDIERSAGFDDDGLDTQTVTASTSAAATAPATGTVTVSKTQAYVASTASPLNATVALTELPAAQQANPVDPTKVGGKVGYDVKVLDQFGNPVGGETVTVAVTGGTVDNASVSSDFDAAADVTLTSNTAGNATVTLSYTAPVNDYISNGATPPVATAHTGTKVVTAAKTQTFYAPDFATSTFTISHSPTGTQPTGTIVTETVKAVDQFGNPSPGITVQFFRTGPGGDNEGPISRTTDASGNAIYSFAGNNAGTAQITAVFSQGSATKNITDTVTFQDPTPVPHATTFTLTHTPTGEQPVGSTVTETLKVLDQNGMGYAGATVNFVRSGPNGQSDSATATTNAAGEATYTFVGTAAGTANITAVVDYTEGTKSLTDSVVFAETGPGPVVATSFAIAHTPANDQTVGATVTETVTVLDQNGDGFAGASVNFLRSGPNGQTESATAVTNAAGQAVYAFTGTAAGTANITAVVNYGDGNKTLTDSVSFKDNPIAITATIENVGRTGKNDVLRVSASSTLAKGATVTLYANTTGTAQVIATAKINSIGKYTFYVVDPNGAKVGTKYHAVISATAKTKPARTSTISVK